MALLKSKNKTQSNYKLIFLCNIEIFFTTFKKFGTAKIKMLHLCLTKKNENQSKC